MSKRVMLAMSGGVDSSAALVLLQRQGYEVIGATMRLYDNEDIGDKSSACCSLSDVEDARAVAARFGVTHYVFNFTDRFRKDVIERFNDEYLRGLTPNPCIDCNRFLKFSALLERAEMMECDYIATGHYARIRFDEQSGRYLLLKAVSSEGENVKDQSYVLYDLTQEQMKKVLFPLGEMEKSEVRKIAKEYGLVNYDKPDSQDICFVPDGDYARFIREYTGIVPECGDVVDSKGNVLGRHEGLINYTIGQRKGLGIAFGKPMYVIDKNVGENTVTVGENEELFSDGLRAVNVNVIADLELGKAVRCKAKTRYKQVEQECEAVFREDGTAEVLFMEPQRAVTKGQRVVFYDGDVVLGGGVIA
ncbi:MAG: tRNA 2-thiouridine(34) synthase MnmA [Oscillospiraceae bacterium]|nr:tRNA 2-thiouridine(34) synthase MnmA [Oscillospiraceae bacterium]